MSMRRRALLAQMNDADVVGLQVDFENNTFNRLAGARGRRPGMDFDCFAPFGGRRRCCVADDGRINAFYGEAGYAEDGAAGQVMVYQPAFFYRTEPLKVTPKTDGTGAHLKKVNYYVSASPKPGFKRHPLFYKESGEAADYVLLSAYEASYYDDSLGRIFSDGTDTDSTIDFSLDRLCSLAGQKPVSGLKKRLTRANAEALAAARGAGWHIDTIKALAATQMLMLVEYGAMNMQNAIGQGVVSLPDLSGANCAVLTGSTASLGNATGTAEESVRECNGTLTPYRDNGKTAISYRGAENPWGNMWNLVNGAHLWGDGTFGAGMVYVCRNTSFAYSENTADYEPTGLTLPSGNGYAASIGYSEPFDWLFIPSRNGGTASLPVGDYSYAAADLNGYRILRLGGDWEWTQFAGMFAGRYVDEDTLSARSAGFRLLYLPA